LKYGSQAGASSTEAVHAAQTFIVEYTYLSSVQKSFSILCNGFNRIMYADPWFMGTIEDYKMLVTAIHTTLIQTATYKAQTDS